MLRPGEHPQPAPLCNNLLSFEVRLRLEVEKMFSEKLWKASPFGQAQDGPDSGQLVLILVGSLS